MAEREEYPLSFRNLASSILSSDIDEQAVLLHEMGLEIEYAKDPDSKDPALRDRENWYVKQGDQWKLLNKSGISGKDIMNLGGEALVMLPGVGMVSKFARPLAKMAILKYLARNKIGRAGMAGALTALTELGRQAGSEMVAPEMDQMLNEVDRDQTVRIAAAAVGGSAGSLIGDMAFAMARNIGKTQSQAAFVSAVSESPHKLAKLKKTMGRQEYNRNIEAYADDLSSRIAASSQLDDAGLKMLNREISEFQYLSGAPKDAVNRIEKNLKSMSDSAGPVKGIDAGNEFRRKMDVLGTADAAARMLVRTSLTGVPPVGMMRSAYRAVRGPRKEYKKNLKRMDMRKIPAGAAAVAGVPAGGGFDYGSEEVARYLWGGS